MDVNNDGFVAPNDALIIINEINLHGPSSLEGLLEGNQPRLFIDVSADNYIAPNDALLVINYINAHSTPRSATLAAGEGESAAASHDAALASLFASLEPGGRNNKRL
jgi:hypothetical protein